MANNVLSNGRIQHATAAQRLSTDKAKKVPDIPAIESRNWLLHRHYTRHEYKICKILIQEELTRSNGHNEYANYLQGLIMRKEGKIQDSLDCFQNAYNVNSRNVNNVKQIAKSLYLLGSHNRALEAYLEAERISAIPDWEILYNIGECYTRFDKREEAKKYLKKAVDLTKDEMPHIALAKLYIMDDQVTEAVGVYTSALDGSPQSENIATELGLLYLKMGDTQRAFQQFGSALAQSPTCSKALLPMASIMQTHRDYDVALSKYKIAAQTIPESSALWNNVGMCFYGKQKFVAAISCLKRAHYLNPMALYPACNLGIVFLTTGQPASAATYLCAAVSAGPMHPSPYLLLGLALRQLDDLEAAEKALTKAHSLAPQDPLVLINYAIILDAKGDQKRAADTLTALTDVSAVINVDPEVAETARKLTAKLRRSDNSKDENERILNDDEV
ncbi:Bardet-Biedl syndrome 4 protein homolog [Cephus cinctus]|uniref:Bardet-Biedl syndrome 4 protein homolog n=1 Tax=Cephus cinctus TaxID=211228 RepID=A0AAJ7BJC8_CEPCN|nr:Bardet-Biedl syndrome 4 protein homolog [Cephus cinctus]